MNLIRWDPLGDGHTLVHLMPSAARAAAVGAGVKKSAWSPAADISETDKEYLIRIDLPAVNKEDVKVTLEQGLLTVAGERKRKIDDRNEKFHRLESAYGTFDRSFSLPDSIDGDAVRCENRDGVLTVYLPKIATPQPSARQITVQ